MIGTKEERDLLDFIERADAKEAAEKNKDEEAPFDVDEKTDSNVAPIKPRFKGKVIIANSGTGKSYVSGHPDIIDGDDIFVEVTNALLDKYGESDHKISSVSTINDIWLLWGKGEKGKLKEYTKRRKEVYAGVAVVAKEYAKQGKTVLLASAREETVAIADLVIFQEDTKTLKKSRKSNLRENVLDMTDEEIYRKNVQFAHKITSIPDRNIVHLAKNTFIGNVIFDKQKKNTQQTSGKFVESEKTAALNARIKSGTKVQSLVYLRELFLVDKLVEILVVL